MCCKASTLSEELHKRYLKNVAFGMKDNPIIDSDDVLHQQKFYIPNVNVQDTRG